MPESGDVPQAFDIRFMEVLLKAFDDPDWYFCKLCARAVWLGSTDRKLPRTPAVFDRKVKWRFPEPGPDAVDGWCRNYPSFEQHSKIVQSQFEAEAEEGFMVETTVGKALDEYGDRLEIASTAAIEKKDRTDEVRVLYDGSNGLDLNPGIRVRDQVKYPTLADAKGVIAKAADEGGPHFSLKYDILKAHRRVAVEKSEWG